MNTSDEINQHTISMTVDNEAGVLARVIGLFSGRGYNIDSLTVAAISDDDRTSRITVVTSGTRMVIEQIKAQLERLVPVDRVSDLTLEGESVERELALLKMSADDNQADKAKQVADEHGARIVDITPKSFVVELTGTVDAIDAFIDQMEGLGMIEVARGGVVAVASGSKGL